MKEGAPRMRPGDLVSGEPPGTSGSVEFLGRVGVMSGAYRQIKKPRTKSSLMRLVMRLLLESGQQEALSKHNFKIKLRTQNCGDRWSEKSGL